MAELPVVKRLRKEMEILKRELNVELPKELERARAHGDLSENAEWAMAKQRQEFLRARLNNLEARVAELSMINIDSIPRDTEAASIARRRRRSSTQSTRLAVRCSSAAAARLIPRLSSNSFFFRI